MIIDTLPNQYEILAQQHSFRPWQIGLLGDMLSMYRQQFLTINMGRQAGHTYFTRVLASSDFPIHTKAYVTRQEKLPEFSSLLFDESRVHEPIGILSMEGECEGIPDAVKCVVVDMSGERPTNFKNSLGMIAKNVPQAKIVVLQPVFFKI